MESPSEPEPGRRPKVISYKRHRRDQRNAERDLNATTLEEAINVGGPAKLIEAKDAHETAAVNIKHDLNSE